MAGLGGRRIALLESRMGSELSAIVQRQGGVPYAVPAVREAHLAVSPETAALIADLCAGRFAAVVFMTGAGATALLDECAKAGDLDRAIASLRSATTVCRGPKPAAVLRKHHVQVSIAAPEPHTTVQLLEALDGTSLRGKRVALVHYGERNDEAAAGLRQRGAAVSEICLYEWRLPEDLSGLEHLTNDLIERRVDALAVTSQIQVRHLFEVARRMGRADALADALRTDVVVAAVGPVCASALRSHGVVPRVEPAHPKMGPMVLALAEYFELTR